MAMAALATSQFNSFMTQYGAPVSITNYSRAYSGADYDDEILTASGSSTGSLFFQPLDKSAEKQYLEQGLLKETDMKIFYPSGLAILENTDLVFNSGSWTVLPAGMKAFSVQGTEVYRVAFVRAKTP